MPNDPTLIAEQPWMKGEKYYSYTCIECGEQTQNTYCEPHRTNMLELRVCYTCNHWRDFEKRLEREHATMTIIEGHVYGPGNRTTGEFRGMAGRRFDIEYIEPSVYVGQRTTTFDLWSGSTLPDRLKEKFADTAVFLNGAERCQVGETGCWNPSQSRAEPYPLPCKLKPTAREGAPNA